MSRLRRAHDALAVAATTSIAGLAAACQLVFPTVTGGGAEAGAETDGATGDAGADHAAPEGPWLPLDAGWATFALGVSSKYLGAAFDGRYLYLSPSPGGTLHARRYDTTKPFEAPSSWLEFDLPRVDPRVTGFAGVTFDGHDLYFSGATYAPATGTPNVFVRYDRGNFQDPASWTAFDVSQLSPKALGSAGGTFDGRFLYFAPLHSGYAVRYDTTKSFTAKTSWSGFDLSMLGADATGYDGVLFDGASVYFVPYAYDNFTDAGSHCNSLVARYDRSRPFDSASSWKTFDLSMVDGRACGFIGGAFDGRYVYLSPYLNGLGRAARYDTQGAGFEAASSWETFSMQRVDPNVGSFVSAAYDGRYVTFAPNLDAVGANGGVITRFDTTGTFNDPASWDSFDATQVDPAAIGFGGAAFDGEYLYFVPELGAIVARHTTRKPSKMPGLPDFFGSFY